jgi:hypothetical protein
VYDVIFHPDTLYLAGKDPRMKDLVNATAFDGLETAFKIRVDRAFLRYPKMSFKGVFRPTVIRKSLLAGGQTTGTDAAATAKPASTSGNDVVVPSYDIRYRSSVDLQDFVIKERYQVEMLTKSFYG